jgi:hypothetical protein
MMPMPPAFETAEDKCDRAIQPMAAWMMGFSMPSISVMRVWTGLVLIFVSSCWQRRRERPGLQALA